MQEKKDSSPKIQADSFGTFLEIAQNISERPPVEAKMKGDLLSGLDVERQLEEAASPAQEDEQDAGRKVLRLVAEYQPLSVTELMRRCKLEFLQFARQMNQLAENGLLEISSSEDDPEVEMVRLSLRGQQIADALSGEM